MRWRWTLRVAAVIALAASPARAGVGDILAPRPEPLATPGVDAIVIPAPLDPATLMPALPFDQRWIGRPVAQWSFMPDARLYPARLAEPRSPGVVCRVIGSARWHRPQLETGIGGEWSFVRWHPDGTDDWGFEFGAYTAIFMRFDLEHDTDLLGTDGIWGFPVSWRWGEFAAKVQIGHISGHLGDETIFHQGKDRLNYLKEELTTAVAWEPARWFRLYAEFAGAIRLGGDHGPNQTKPFRADWGGEFTPFMERPDTWPFYVALHASSRQEVGWNISTTTELGWVAWADGHHRSWRFSFTWHVGREIYTQFHDKHTQWWAISMTADW